MVRIFGVNLPSKKKAYIALTAVHGVGVSTSKKVLNELNISENISASALSELQVVKIREMLELSGLKFEGDLDKFVDLNIKRLVEINSFRGKRHLKGLPTRGQRTRTNAQTASRLNTLNRASKRKRK